MRPVIEIRPNPNPTKARIELERFIARPTTPTTPAPAKAERKAS